MKIRCATYTLGWIITLECGCSNIIRSSCKRLSIYSNKVKLTILRFSLDLQPLPAHPQRWPASESPVNINSNQALYIHLTIIAFLSNTTCKQKYCIISHPSPHQTFHQRLQQAVGPPSAGWSAGPSSLHPEGCDFQTPCTFCGTERRHVFKK